MKPGHPQSGKAPRKSRKSQGGATFTKLRVVPLLRATTEGACTYTRCLNNYGQTKTTATDKANMVNERNNEISTKVCHVAKLSHSSCHTRDKQLQPIPAYPRYKNASAKPIHPRIAATRIPACSIRANQPSQTPPHPKREGEATAPRSPGNQNCTPHQPRHPGHSVQLLTWLTWQSWVAAQPQTSSQGTLASNGPFAARRARTTCKQCAKASFESTRQAPWRSSRKAPAASNTAKRATRLPLLVAMSEPYRCGSTPSATSAKRKTEHPGTHGC